MAQNGNGFRGMLNRKAAAAYVGMNESSFRKYLKKKGTPKPKHYEIGVRMLFKTEHLDEWVENFLKV